MSQSGTACETDGQTDGLSEINVPFHNFIVGRGHN